MFILTYVFALLIAALFTVWYSKKRARKVHDLRWRLLGLRDLCGRGDSDIILEDVYEASSIYSIEPAELGFEDFSEMQAEAVASMRLYRKRLFRRHRESYERFKELMAIRHWSSDESKEFRSLRETVMKNGAELNALHRRLALFARTLEISRPRKGAFLLRQPDFSAMLFT